MATVPLHLDRPPGGRPSTPPRNARLVGSEPTRRRGVPSPASMARRRWLIRWTKRLLPVLALAILTSVAMWPELDREQEQGRVAFRRMATGDTGAARLIDARYRGVDERGRPYTLTADTAEQAGPERVNLSNPKGDAILQNGSWIMVQARHGVYMQHVSQLDLAGDVTLYRQDGTTVVSNTATMDLKAGAGASDQQTHAEGPFGTLDAQGYALVDKGAVIQFTGPARLVLNGGQH
ncbi:MAG TPA: LPS export ABC transporter periplasmic protein LptC [Acetobacteraceae bacterium]|nr:LPS export ABC transporter periplasmic protein LptC [Acetobacteraceae bacterium]